MVGDLKLEHYDCVEDIIEEVLNTFCGINTYYLDDIFENDEEFICGAINIVKRGKNKGSLIHKYNDGTWHEAEISDSYKYAIYYKVSELENILPKLSRKNYNNEYFYVNE